MRYDDIKTWKGTDFKRLTGVQRRTFAKMLRVLERELPNFGRPPKLSRADQLLMTLMYWQEYRTQFHIAGSYGVSEATFCRTINKVEDALMRSGEFSLPGKKVLQPSDTLLEVILVDVSEQPIERPKKSKNVITAAKRSDIPRKRK
jgi:acyl-CoA synthetase (AMP-forming)/AMP-acid ligase II